MRTVNSTPLSHRNVSQDNFVQRKKMKRKLYPSLFCSVFVLRTVLCFEIRIVSSHRMLWDRRWKMKKEEIKAIVPAKRILPLRQEPKK